MKKKTLSKEVRKMTILPPPPPPYSALTVARFFLSQTDKNAGDLISNLKLQKLLYYAQGYYVGYYGASNPLFSDEICAWKHGPVVQAVYQHYSSHKDGALPKSQRPTTLDGDTVKFLEDVYRNFGRFSAWALREMTHKEDPWLDNYKPNVRDIVIPLCELHAFFKGKIKRGK